MSWKDNLLPASFRGVPFQYEAAEREGGRRLAEFEFPLRDENYIEDLGKRAKVHTLTAYVLGDDYFTARDALEDALDQEGSGTLVHPYKGNITVCCRTYRLKETQEDGRMARFEIVFVDSGAQPSPTAAIDTAGVSTDAADGLDEAQTDNFASDFSADDLPAFMRASLAAIVGLFASDAGALTGYPGVDTTDIGGLLTGLSGLIDDPQTLASQVIGYFSGYSAAALLATPSLDRTLTSRGAPFLADPTFGLADFATWGNDLPAVPGVTPDRLQQAASQDAFVSLVQGSAVSAIARVFAGSDFASAQDAENARDQIAGMIDSQVEASAPNDTLTAALDTLYQASISDLTQRGQQLPELVQYRFNASYPSLGLSQRLYGDGSRADELVARNAAPHPLFMPLDISALAT